MKKAYLEITALFRSAGNIKIQLLLDSQSENAAIIEACSVLRFLCRAHKYINEQACVVFGRTRCVNITKHDNKADYYEEHESEIVHRCIKKAENALAIKVLWCIDKNLTFIMNEIYLSQF